MSPGSSSGELARWDGVPAADTASSPGACRAAARAAAAAAATTADDPAPDPAGSPASVNSPAAARANRTNWRASSNSPSCALSPSSSRPSGAPARSAGLVPAPARTVPPSGFPARGSTCAAARLRIAPRALSPLGLMAPPASGAALRIRSRRKRSSSRSLESSSSSEASSASCHSPVVPAPQADSRSPVGSTSSTLPPSAARTGIASDHLVSQEPCLLIGAAGPGPVRRTAKFASHEAAITRTRLRPWRSGLVSAGRRPRCRASCGTW